MELCDGAFVWDESNLVERLIGSPILGFPVLICQNTSLTGNQNEGETDLLLGSDEDESELLVVECKVIAGKKGSEKNKARNKVRQQALKYAALACVMYHRHVHAAVFTDEDLNAVQIIHTFDYSRFLRIALRVLRQNQRFLDAMLFDTILGILLEPCVCPHCHLIAWIVPACSSSKPCRSSNACSSKYPCMDAFFGCRNQCYELTTRACPSTWPEALLLPTLLQERSHCKSPASVSKATVW